MWYYTSWSYSLNALFQLYCNGCSIVTCKWCFYFLAMGSSLTDPWKSQFFEVNQRVCAYVVNKRLMHEGLPLTIPVTPPQEVPQHPLLGGSKMPATLRIVPLQYWHSYKEKLHNFYEKLWTTRVLNLIVKEVSHSIFRTYSLFWCFPANLQLIVSGDKSSLEYSGSSAHAPPPPALHHKCYWITWRTYCHQWNSVFPLRMRVRIARITPAQEFNSTNQRI